MAKKGRPDVTLTAFCVTFINDPELVPEACVLMVYNRSDVEQDHERFADEDLVNLQYYGALGKPAGIGLPGGGQKIEDLESPTETARNEFRGETGFDVKNLSQLFINPKILIIDKSSNRTMSIISYEMGQTPPYTLRNGQIAVENRVHIFHGNVDWEGSAFQKLLIKKKKEFIGLGQLTEEEVARFGMWVRFDELSHEELGSLDIEELDEISMMGIFPLSFLSDALIHENLRNDFYYSHLERINRACKMLGMHASSLR